MIPGPFFFFFFFFRFLSMERQSDCSPLSGPRLHRFGQLDDPGKRLGRGTIVRAGFCSTTTQSNLTTRWDGNH